MEVASRVQVSGRYAIDGRAADLAAVLALVDGPAAGGCLVLRGAAGSGRTTLLDAARCLAAGHRTVLAAPGDAEETALAGGGLQRLLAPVLAHTADLPEPHRAALFAAGAAGAADGTGAAGAAEFPGAVRAVGAGAGPKSWTPGGAAGDLPGGGAVPHSADRLTLGLAVLGLLRAAARERPLLVLLDDADRLDRLSFDALALAARRLAGDAVAVLAAVPDRHPPTGLPSRLLAPLDPPTARALLARLAPGICADVAATLADLAGGNVAALTDLAAALTPEQLRGEAAPPVTLPAGSRLRRTYRSMLAALPERTRSLLLLAAAHGGADGPGPDDGLAVADLRAAALACGIDLSALAPAELAGMVGTAGPVVTFPVPVLRAVTYDEAPLDRRRAAHAVLAGALAARGRRLPALLHRAAVAAAPDEDLARALTAAAADATRPDAAAACQRAAELTARPAAATAALLDAAGHAWLAGRRATAAVLLRRVLRTEPGGHVGARAGRLAAEMELGGGAAAVARDALLAEADRLARHDVPAAVDALLTAGDALHLAGRHDRYEEVARRARALWHGDEPPETELALRHIAGLAAMFRGDHPEAFAELGRVVRLGERVHGPAALHRAAIAALLTGDGLEARDLALRAVVRARARGETALVPHALGTVAFADLAGGQYEAAAGAAVEGAELARATGQPYLAGSHLGILAVLAALMGDEPACLLRVREAGAHDSADGPGQARALCEWALGVLDLVRGRPEATVDRLRCLITAPSGRGNLVMQVAATPHLVEAAACAATAGHRIAAPGGADLDAFDRWTTATGRPAWLALRERCRALRATDGRTADEHFQEALRLHRAGDADFPRAHTELLYGRELRRRRRPAAARAHLRGAVETFRLLGAGPWAEQAARELRAAGEPVPHPVPGPDRRLTAQQERIARLVAEGATNREIAERLFLSPRTVDHHLRNVFVRLGVRSRTELARLMPAS
jgi:DNA-binding CsgD family transcriptional regulator